MFRFLIAAAIIVCALFSASRASAQPADITWANQQNDWTTNGSWVGGIAPLNSLFSHRAVFSNTTTISAQPTLSGTTSIAGLSFNNTGDDWSLLGTGMLRIGGSGFVVSGSGTTSVAPSVHVMRNQSWNVGSGAALQTSGNLFGAATVTLTGAGAKHISGTNNMFHGTIVYGAGTLTINNPSTALRNSALVLNSTSTLVVGGSLRIGELTSDGNGTLNLGGNELRILTLNNANYSGTLVAGSISVFGLGSQSFNSSTLNRLAGVTGDLIVGRGAEIALSGNGSFTNAGNNVVLREGRLSINTSYTNANRYLNAAAGLTITGGGTFFMYASTGDNQTLASLNMGHGHANIGLNTNDLNDPALLTFSSSSGLGDVGTINFSGTNLANGKRLGQNVVGDVSPMIRLTGHSQGFMGAYATVDQTDFANYSTSVNGGVQRAISFEFAMAGTSSNAIINSSTSYSSSSSKTVQSLKLDASTSLDIGGSGGVSTAGVLLTANRTFTIRNTGGGTGNLSGPGGTMYFHVFLDSKLAVETNVAQGSNIIVKAGEGTLILSPRTTNTMGGIYINQGAVQAAMGTGLPNGAVVRLRGGVLEISGGGTLSKTVGTAAGNINWQDTGGAGSGGFSAVGGTLTVDLNGAGATNLIWGQTRFIQNDYALTFGSRHSDSNVFWVDHLALNSGNQSAYEIREIYVDGSSSTPWKTTLSGVISSVAFGGSTNGQRTDLLKTGTGTLELTGNNTYVGGTIIAAGTLLVGHANALGNASQSGAYVQVGDRGASSSAVETQLLLSASITFARDVTVADGNGFRVLGSIAGGTATFAGNIYLNDPVTLRSDGGGVTRFTGVISGNQNLQTHGPGGIVVLSGASTYTGVTTILGGTLRIDADVFTGSDSPIGRGASALQLGPTTGAETATLVTGQAITFQRGVVAKIGSGATGALTLGGAHTSGTADFTGPITLQRSAQLTAAVGGTTRFSGAMTGSGGITKIGGGMVRLDGTTTYTGATIVNAGTLAFGGSATGAAATTVNGGTFRILSGGSYNTASSVIAVAGSNVIVDAGGTLSDSVTGSASITVNGTLSGGVTVNGVGTLRGSGRITGSISGAGLISPGNSPGILDAAQVNPTSGADFLFQFARANDPPSYGNRTNPGNDVLHLTHATTPFFAALTSANKITIDFQVSTIKAGDVFIGGFFTNRPGTDFYGDGSVSAAQIDYLLNGVPITTGLHWLFDVTTIAQSNIDFGSGYGGITNGRVMQVTVIQVPEPSSLLLVGAGWGAWRLRRRKRG